MEQEPRPQTHDEPLHATRYLDFTEASLDDIVGYKVSAEVGGNTTV